MRVCGVQGRRPIRVPPFRASSAGMWYRLYISFYRALTKGSASGTGSDCLKCLLLGGAEENTVTLG